MSSPWPVDVTALTPASCGSVLWRAGGALRLTVIVKATFSFVHNEAATPCEPDPLVQEETYFGNNPAKGVDQAGDLAPYLPCAGVVLSGHAHARGTPVPAAAVRLAIFRGQPLIDKTLHVFGERSPKTGMQPRPFQKMGLDYRRAFGGPGVAANPVGVGGTAESQALPNVVDPQDPQRPAGFGPISKFWTARKQLLGPHDRKPLEEPIAEIPDRFDWRYFCAAPTDQQIDRLHGDEWIVLDGMHPELDRLQTQLPSARAEARWHPIGADGVGEAHPIELFADTLLIDANRGVCSVVWRGSVPLSGVDAAAQMRFYAGVELPGSPIPWIDPDDIRPAASRRAPDLTAPQKQAALPDKTVTLSKEEEQRAAAQPAAPFSPAAALLEQELSDHTMTLAVDEQASVARRPVAPFAIGAPGLAPPPRPIAGAPWSPQPAARVPFQPGQDETMALGAPTLGATPAAAPRAVEPPRIAPPRMEAPILAAPPAALAPAASRAPAVSEERKRAMATLAEQGSFDDADLTGVDLSSLDFSGRSMARCKLRGAKLTAATLAGARLEDADLSGASLEEADLSGAALTRAVLAGARLDRAKLADAVLEEADLTDAALPAASAPRAKLARARGAGASFRGADLSGADLRRATFPRACFDDAVLRDAQADQADFEKARFVRADLGGASLRRAALTAAILAHAKLEATDLRHAILDRANVHGTVRTTAKLLGASTKGLVESAPAEADDAPGPGRSLR